MQRNKIKLKHKTMWEKKNDIQDEVDRVIDDLGGQMKQIKTFAGGDTIIFGTFNGQNMIGEDCKVYPIPGNYASKSRLIEGDKLKLIITEDGRFIYKQILPVKRRQFIGKIFCENGGYFVESDFGSYMILDCSASYFKLENGDEVVAIIPFEKKATWAAIENVIRKVI